MSHEAGQTTDERLVHMANQIATFFETLPPQEAAGGVADHINSFWEPRMRRRFFEIVESGNASLKPLVTEALPHIRRPQDEASTSSG